MDANDLYSHILNQHSAGDELYDKTVDKESMPALRAALRELAAGHAFLSSEEHAFALGIQSNMEQHLPITKKDVMQIVTILRTMRHRIHGAQGSRT